MLQKPFISFEVFKIHILNLNISGFNDAQEIENLEYEGISATSFEVPDLDELTMYYWKVQPYRTDETGDWSNVCNFKTKKSTVSDIQRKIEESV